MRLPGQKGMGRTQAQEGGVACPRAMPCPQALNHLLALATAADPRSARELHHAIAFSIREGKSNLQSPLLITAQNLLRLQHGGERLFAVAHCDLKGLCDDPLWIRQRVVSALRRLAGHREGILLITGLKVAFCPTGRWSPKRKAGYQECQGYIEQLAMRFNGPRSRLRLLYF